MNRLLPQLILFASLLIPLAPSLAADRATASLIVVVDDEYDLYKKKGDDLFKIGKYPEASRQYQNCLEVPGFEDDAYAKGQLDKCTAALTMRQQADDALKEDRHYDAIMLYNKLLALNPDDIITKDRLAAYYENQGNQLYSQQKYAYAKARYEQALPYSSRQETLRLQIRNCEKFLTPVFPKRTGLKLVTGTVAVGAGIYALLLRNDYKTKKSALLRINQTVDPLGTDLIANRDAYGQWENANTAAEAAQKKNGLYKACIGVAAAAAVAELYLLVHKPKPRIHAVNWHPSSTSWGLAATLTF